MGIHEKWLASFGSDKEIWTVSEKGNVYEYLTKDKPNGNPFGRKLIFHVWKGDEWLYCGPSQEKADEVFAEAVKGGMMGERSSGI